MNFKKAFYLLLGVLGLLLGAIGAVLPLMPAFPFLLLAKAAKKGQHFMAKYCFAKSVKAAALFAAIGIFHRRYLLNYASII